MAIFGICFSDLGSRKLRFDSRGKNVNFNADMLDKFQKQVTKYPIYATPEQIEQKSKEKSDNDAPMIKYSVPTESNVSYPPNPTKSASPFPNKPPMIKYAIPSKD